MSVFAAIMVISSFFLGYTIVHSVLPDMTVSGWVILFMPLFVSILFVFLTIASLLYFKDDGSGIAMTLPTRLTFAAYVGSMASYFDWLIAAGSRFT